MPYLQSYLRFENESNRCNQEFVKLARTKVIWSQANYYSYCPKIAEVINGHIEIEIGGADKTVQIDDTFLTKTKYHHRGRITEQNWAVLSSQWKKQSGSVAFNNKNTLIRKAQRFCKTESRRKENVFQQMRTFE